LTQVVQLPNDEKRKYHLKNLYQLSIKSLGEIPQLDEPTDEQKEWINRRIHDSARSWEAYNK